MRINSKDESFITEAMERWKMADAAVSHTRKLSEDDMRFIAGYDEYGNSTQWNSEDLAQWREDKLPALTMNQSEQFLHQVINEGKQQRPAIVVDPLGSGADVPTAEIIQGMIRAIEQSSHANVAYEGGFEPAVKAGFGYWMLRTAYTYDHPKTQDEFNAQHIKIQRIKNPFMVFPDPTGEEPDGSDWDWCFLIEDMPKNIYKAKYGKSDMAGLINWQASGSEMTSWSNQDTIRVAEYFYSKWHEETVHLLTDGKVITESEARENKKNYGSPGFGPGVEINQDRKIRYRTIHWSKINAVEVLEQSDWQGKWIPIVPVYGSELSINGRTILYGMVRNSKDIQRAMNYMVSRAVETIGLTPKAPYMAEAKQIEGFEDIYASLNRKSYSVVPYNASVVSSEDGKSFLAPPPQRQQFEAPIQAFNMMVGQFQYMLRGAMGLYGPSLGEASGANESGQAVRSRQFQGQRATYHFQSNWERAIWHTGRILVDLIPKVYDGKQVVEIIGKDEQRRSITLDPSITESEREAAAKEGRYNIQVGLYGVSIRVGPGNMTLRQERVAQVSEILKTISAVLPPAAALMLTRVFFRNLDLDGAQDVVEELNKMIEKSGQIPPEVQQQMRQMAQQLQIAMKELNDAKMREAAKSMEIASKERIEALKASVDIARIKADTATKLSQLQSKEDLALLDSHMEQVEREADRLAQEQPQPQ